MLDVFVRNLRLISQLIVHPSVRTDPEGFTELSLLREKIARNFPEVSAAAGAISYETGPARAQQMMIGGRVKRWQAMLRTFYLMETSLLQSYHFEARTEVSDSIRQVEIQFQQATGSVLTSIADCLEKQMIQGKCEPQFRPDFEKLLNSAEVEKHPVFSSHEQTLLGLSRDIGSLLDQLAKDVYAVSLFTGNAGSSSTE